MGPCAFLRNWGKPIKARQMYRMKSFHKTVNRILPTLALLALAALFLCPSSAPAASAKSYFIVGHSDFHALLKNRKKAKFRSNWQKVEKSFSRCLKADPDGSYAPKALYYIGRVHEELGIQSGLKSDFRRAWITLGVWSVGIPGMAGLMTACIVELMYMPVGSRKSLLPVGIWQRSLSNIPVRTCTQRPRRISGSWASTTVPLPRFQGKTQAFVS